jgi:hypothetical protein
MIVGDRNEPIMTTTIAVNGAQKSDGRGGGRALK